VDISPGPPAVGRGVDIGDSVKRKYTEIIVLLILIIDSFSCSNKRNSIKKNQKPADVDNLISNPFIIENSYNYDEEIINLGKTLSKEEEVLDKLVDKEQLKYSKTEKFENIELFRGTNDPQLHTHFILTVNRIDFNLKNGMHIGDSIESVLRYFGEPDQKSEEYISYSTNDRKYEINFYYSNQKITKIIWVNTL
jgi:hypothetical protein